MSPGVPTTLKRKKDKGKQKASLATAAADPGGKNEGVDPSWAFQPSPGVKLIQNIDVDNGEFDWDAINADEDVELWVLRVPESVKPKHLEGLTLDSPASSSRPENKQKTTRIGALKHKHTTFDIWSLDNDANEEGHPVGGDELKALSCLLPRKSERGRMYAAPRPIARHIVLSAQPPQLVPTSPSSNKPTMTLNGLQGQMLTNPPRHRYSPDLLTHRFMPYGSFVDTKTFPSPGPRRDGGKGSNEDEDVVMAEMDHNLPPSPPSTQPDTTVTRKSKSKTKKAAKVESGDVESATKEKARGREKKSRKRKGEDSEEVVTSKKPKKTKTAR